MSAAAQTMAERSLSTTEQGGSRIDSPGRRPTKQAKPDSGKRQKAIGDRHKAQPATRPPSPHRAQAKTRNAPSNTAIALASATKPRSHIKEPLLNQAPLLDPPREVAASSPEQLTELAKTMEQTGRYDEALKYYRQAADTGYGPASLRLAELYITGAAGLKRDYAQSIHWYERAREQGMPVATMEKR